MHASLCSRSDNEHSCRHSAVETDHLASRRREQRGPGALEPAKRALERRSRASARGPRRSPRALSVGFRSAHKSVNIFLFLSFDLEVRRLTRLALRSGRPLRRGNDAGNGAARSVREHVWGRKQDSKDLFGPKCGRYPIRLLSDSCQTHIKPIDRKTVEWQPT